MTDVAHADGAFEAFFGLAPRHQRETRVADERVDLVRLQRLREAADARERREVEFGEFRSTSRMRGARAGNGGFAAGDRAARVDHARAGAGQRSRRRVADAGVCTGDDDRARRQVKTCHHLVGGRA